MLKRNNFITGLIVGLIVPLLAWGLLGGIFSLVDSANLLPPDEEGSNFGQRTTALLAICCNLIPFTLFNRKKFSESMRGMIFPTVAFAIAWYIYFSSHLKLAS